MTQDEADKAEDKHVFHDEAQTWVFRSCRTKTPEYIFLNIPSLESVYRNAFTCFLQRFLLELVFLFLLTDPEVSWCVSFSCVCLQRDVWFPMKLHLVWQSLSCFVLSIWRHESKIWGLRWCYCLSRIGHLEHAPGVHYRQKNITMKGAATDYRIDLFSLCRRFHRARDLYLLSLVLAVNPTAFF